MSVVKIDKKQLVQFEQQMQRLSSHEAAKFTKQAIVEVGNRFVDIAKKETPVDTGFMRRQWKANPPQKHGHEHSVDVVNAAEYAQYVDQGHRQGKSGWVKGQFFVKRAEEQVARETPPALIKKLNKFIGERMP